MNPVVARKANRQEILNLIQSIPKPSPSMVNLACHFTFADLADRVVAKEFLSHLFIGGVLLDSFFGDWPKSASTL